MADEAGGQVTLDLRKLEKFIKALKANPPQARVGVMGATQRHGGADAKTGDQPTNAEIGAKHEYGSITDNIPQRSFLRIPLTDNLPKYLERSNAFDVATFTRVVNESSLHEWTEKLGMLGEQIVAEAFASGGFGQWKELSPVTIARKKTSQILVETQQLRDAISSEVVG